MRDFLAGLVMFVIAMDLVVLILAGVASLYRIAAPIQLLSFLAVANACAWGFALADDGHDIKR